MQTLPLFPLPTVLYPGGYLPLQIFEPRYLRMVKQCLANSSGFVVVQSIDGLSASEEGRAPFYPVGCYGEIDDWHPLPNDLLGIDLHGQYKVRIHDYRAEQDGLLVGQCEILPAEAPTPVSDRYPQLIRLLQDIQKHPMIQMLGLDIDYQDASEVGYRLAELLPFSGDEKQLLLESDDPLARLDAIKSLIRQLGG
ncbi:LON peptidase substrate-binding domain-containing protein [Marinobacterium arenosum]|uniref:LON peptidase substrate-binding domain-containing protein n=1 Tax=Marinobacterium arenosum TaxID=2862496 RepID=UPI001C97B47A|nr:LON peptidase substrate-binding domain-containing protein [Marinobacterium arenosum]MBY4678215.1 LON peptidase substrate-binding domain-containing protein [Marinobacterium arenosum]